MSAVNDYSPAALTVAALRAKGEPKLFETSTKVWKEKLVAWFEEASGRTLYPDQTEMFLIEMLAYLVGLQNEERQAAILQNVAVWASGRHLDDTAANVSITRLPATKARATVQFVLATARGTQLVIPRGQRLNAGELAFVTLDDAVIARGQTSAIVLAEATEAGLRHNGLLAGQLFGTFGAIAPGLTATNTTVSAGGAAEETDDHLTQIVVDAPEQFDRRGGWGGYGLAVRRVNALITDVAIDRPEPGHIDLYPLLEGDEAPGEELLADILAALPPDTQRPQGDYVTIKAATPFDVDLAITLRIDPNAIIAEVEAAAEANVRAAFVQFRRPFAAGSQRTQFSPETGRLGAQLGAGPLTAACTAVSGVIDAAVVGLSYTDLPFNQFPRLASVSFTTIEAEDE